MRAPLLATIFFALPHIAAHAYPVLVNVENHFELNGWHSNAVVALAPAASGGLRRIAVQADELEEGQLLVIRNPTVRFPLREKLHHPSDTDPFHGRLAKYHRLVLDDDAFGVCTKEEDCSPSAVEEAAVRACGKRNAGFAPSAVRIDLKFNHTTAFLAECAGPVAPFGNPRVNFDDKERRITGDSYEIVYSRKSPFIMDSFKLLPDDPVMGSTYLAVTIKPKLFFPFSFDHDNIVPELTALKRGPVGFQGEMSLALKTIGITTKRSITADMTAYRDAFYLPVVLDLPFSRSTLRDGSGFFYAFEFFGDPEQAVETPLARWPQKGAGGNHAIVTTRTGVVGIAIRTRGSEFPRANILDQKGIQALGFDFPKANVGVFVDLTAVDDDDAKQRFDLWFYYGSHKERERVRAYASSGVEYGLRVWN